MFELLMNGKLLLKKLLALIFLIGDRHYSSEIQTMETCLQSVALLSKMPCVLEPLKSVSFHRQRNVFLIHAE